MRKIKQFQYTGPDNVARVAVVYFHVEWEEYTVKFYRAPSAYAMIEYLGVMADYHTDHKDDALSTADYFVNREVS